MQQRQYVIWITRKAAETLGLALDRNNFGHQIHIGGSWQRMKERVLIYPDADVAAIGFREGEGIETIKMLAVYNQANGEQIRTKDQALAELLGISLDKLAPQPVQSK